jgi:diguanylate cyclase
MSFGRSILQIARGSDAGVGRLLRYWVVGLGLYAACLATLWFQSWRGVAPQREVVWLSAASIAGAGLGYLAIRLSPRLRWRAMAINGFQIVCAISCVIGAYAVLGPMRGVSLSILVGTLVFGAFSSTPRQMLGMSLYTITLLGLTMLWKAHSEPARYPRAEELTHFAIATTMLVAVAYLAEMLSRLRRKLKAQTRELVDALARIHHLATRDELTQLVNRRQMSELAAHEAARRDRSGAPLCLAVIDIDHFKRVNDTHGHAAGDAVLRSFAELALAAVRRTDVMARWGGEEFLLLLPATGIDAAGEVLERMRAHARDAPRPDDPPTPAVTFSAGLVESPAGESIDAAIERADQAMYRAKREGRDRVVSVPRERARVG